MTENWCTCEEKDHGRAVDILLWGSRPGEVGVAAFDEQGRQVPDVQKAAYQKTIAEVFIILGEAAKRGAITDGCTIETQR